MMKQIMSTKEQRERDYMTETTERNDTIKIAINTIPLIQELLAFKLRRE